MANTVAKKASPTASKSGTAAKAKPSIPFVRAAHKLTLIGNTFTSAALSADTQDFGPFDDPSGGFLRAIILDITASGGAAGGATVEAAPDAPWSVIRSIEHADVNGRALIYPTIKGFDVAMMNKYGSFTFNGDPSEYDDFVNVDANGNFHILLAVPVEIDAMDGYGSLPNLSSVDPYRLSVTVAKAADLYTTPPNTLPTIQVKQYHQNWSLPAAQDSLGNTQETEPPDMNTTQYWSKTVFPVTQGQNTIKLARTGNLLRNIVCVLRDVNGVRDAADYPDDLTITWDRYQLTKESRVIRRKFMTDFFGKHTPHPAGVFVYMFTEDGSAPGAERRNLWIPTLQPTEIIFEGTFGAAGTLEIITNDIAPVGGR